MAYTPRPMPDHPTSTRAQAHAQEVGWGLLLLVLGVGMRLLFVHAFPTQPISDFRGIIDFALDLRDKSLFVTGYYWDVFNLGPPLALSLVLRVFPGDPDAVARNATAVWSGLMPLLPFLLWRRTLPLWVRVAAGGMLAIWPGQVLFSGVVSQENWSLLPTVALACLAVPPMLDPERRHPVAAGLLYALSVAMRQEMLYVLLPVLLAAGGFLRRAGWRPRHALACVLAVGIPLLALAVQRQKATGHFALSSGHVGVTLLGTVIPGATTVGWLDPVAYIASVEPELTRDRKRMFAEAKRIALDEVRRRPGFQVLRVVTMAIRYPFRSESELLYWSVGPGTLPPSSSARGQALAGRASPLLKVELIALQALFLAAVGLGIARRNGAILVLTLAVLLKIGLHAVLVATGRFFVPATALEIVVVALGAWEASRWESLRVPAKALAWGLAGSVALFLVAKPLYSRVRSLDTGEEEQRTYRFTLISFQHPGELRCLIRRGRLTALGDTEAVLETFHAVPAPGEKAVAECTLIQPGPAIPLDIQMLDGYAPGGSPGRMLLRAEVDGRTVVSHDLAAEPGTGWVDAPAGPVGAGAPKRVNVEIAAVAPDPGVAWGPAAAIRFRLAPAP